MRIVAGPDKVDQMLHQRGVQKWSEVERGLFRVGRLSCRGLDKKALSLNFEQFPKPIKRAVVGQRLF